MTDVRHVDSIQVVLPSPAGKAVSMSDVHRDYIAEHLRRKGSYVPRAASALANLHFFFDPMVDPQTLRIGDFQRYEDFRYSQGVQSPTVRREFTLHKAAMRHALRRERIHVIPHLEMPSGEVISDRRPATEDEFQRLMRDAVMPYRIRMFFRVAYWTGHRAKAIEELTWDRVDFERGLIDFTLPGVRKTTKRRNASFPIPSGLLPFLEHAHKRHEQRFPDDPYVIGAGPRGVPSCTWRDCKKAWISVGVNVPGLARHCMRKTFVTERLKKGKPLAIVASLIADRAATAEKYYAKFLADDLREIANND